MMGYKIIPPTPGKFAPAGGGPPVLTGTPTAITWAAGADPASQNIDIPTDATAVYWFWSYWRGANGNGLTSVTLNGNAPNQSFQITTVDTGLLATGVAVWYNPATGLQALDPLWDFGADEGPVSVAVYVKNGELSAWRDVDAAHTLAGTANTVTLTTVANDLVLKFDTNSSGTPAPSLSSGWTNGQTHLNNIEASRLSYISAAGSTQVCDSEDEGYSAVVAVSIPGA